MSYIHKAVNPSTALLNTKSATAPPKHPLKTDKKGVRQPQNESPGYLEVLNPKVQRPRY
jgi:hypothetical protein